MGGLRTGLIKGAVQPFLFHPTELEQLCGDRDWGRGVGAGHAACASTLCWSPPCTALWGAENLIQQESIKPTPVQGFTNKISLQRRTAGKISSLHLATFSEPMLN